MRNPRRGLRCNALLGATRNLNPCPPPMPLAADLGHRLAFFLRLPFQTAISGYLPFPPRSCLALPLAWLVPRTAAPLVCCAQCLVLAIRGLARRTCARLRGTAP